MDLVAGITHFQQASLGSQIQMAVARKLLDNQQYQGDAAVKLIQAASEGFTKAGQSLVGAAMGLGERVDMYA